MNKLAAQFSIWHKTKIGRLVMAILEFALAAALGTRAIDTGSLWQYLFTIIFLIGGVRNLVLLAVSFVRKDHGNK